MVHWELVLGVQLLRNLQPIDIVAEMMIDQLEGAVLSVAIELVFVVQVEKLQEERLDSD